MTQIRLTIPTDGPGRTGDLVRAADGTLVSDDGIETFVTALLFTDARAPAEELPPGSDLRGWWAEAFDTEGDAMGSLLWVPLETGLLTADVTASVEDRATARLQTMVTAGIARSARASVVRNGDQGADLRITIEPADTAQNQSTWEAFLALR